VGCEERKVRGLCFVQEIWINHLTYDNSCQIRFQSAIKE